MTKRILLTAADSFTGSWLKPALERRGHTVIGTSRTSSEGDRIPLDIADACSVRRVVEKTRPEVLINLAGIAFANHEANRNIYLINVVGALNFLQAFDEVGVDPQHLVFISSATVYASASSSDSIDESHAIDPCNHYAASKAMLELALAQYMDRFPISVVRPFNYTGPGQRDLFFPAKVARCFRERCEELQVGNIDVVRDLSDVRDICELYCELVEHGPAGVLNFCSGRAVRMADLISTCSRLTGHEPRVSRNERFVRAREAGVLIGSTRRLESLLGPLHFRPLEETMQAMLASPEQA